MSHSYVKLAKEEVIKFCEQYFKASDFLFEKEKENFFKNHVGKTTGFWWFKRTYTEQDVEELWISKTFEFISPKKQAKMRYSTAKVEELFNSVKFTSLNEVSVSTSLFSHILTRISQHPNDLLNLDKQKG